MVPGAISIAMVARDNIILFIVFSFKIHIHIHILFTFSAGGMKSPNHQVTESLITYLTLSLVPTLTGMLGSRWFIL